MPLATPTAFDGWTTQPDIQDRAVAKAPETQVFEPATYTKTPTLVGQSPVMRKLFSVIERVAPTDASVLITGATGTGKELAARAIHNLSARCDAAFVDINCSAIPETLIEAELFGHQRGTFTGAHENRSGLFEKASGGTLFRDELRSRASGCFRSFPSGSLLPFTRLAFASSRTMHADRRRQFASRSFSAGEVRTPGPRYGPALFSRSAARADRVPVARQRA